MEGERETVELPPMFEAQTAAWWGLMEIHERLQTGWTLIGGQLVHLHCAERGHFPTRPTDDIDTVVDVRADPTMLGRFTQVLEELQFAPDTSVDGLQHRWRRGVAQLDVLLPDGIGERAGQRPGAGGGRSIPTPGGTQALARSEPVGVAVGAKSGVVRRPNLVGALVLKAAANTSVSDGAKSRHRIDFVSLASLVAARDFRANSLSGKDRSRLTAMVEACRNDPRAMAVEDSDESLSRLHRAAQLD